MKHIAESHGGRAWVESELGAGATFVVAIPAGDTPSLHRIHNAHDFAVTARSDSRPSAQEVRAAAPGERPAAPEEAEPGKA